MEKLTFPLHPVPIYGQDHEKQGKKQQTIQHLKNERAFQRQDNEKFLFDFLYLELKDLKSDLLKSVYFKSLNFK